MPKSLASRKELRQSINQQARELSTRTVLLHHWIAESLGLNTIDHKCLDLILRAESPIAGIQLAKMTGLSTGAITGVVDRLEKAGIVSRERDREDRRVVFIHPEVKKIEAEINPTFVHIGQEFYNVLSNYNDKELAIIADYMTKSIKMSERITENLRDKVNLAKQKFQSESHN